MCSSGENTLSKIVNESYDVPSVRTQCATVFSEDMEEKELIHKWKAELLQSDWKY